MYIFLLNRIVLDSAYSLNDRVFYHNLGTILLYAVVGTLMNFVLIGKWNCTEYGADLIDI